MIKFILNDTEVTATQPPGFLLLDFIRYQQYLTGTKIGCREGDCGACTILIGEVKNNVLSYSTATSCLMAIGSAAGKHIVTIEGINLTGLTAVQQAFAEEGATQCGFCTPGFIVSLTGFCIGSGAPSYTKAVDSVNGNICRCTGYKSIERAAGTIATAMQQRQQQGPLEFAVAMNMIPSYFLKIQERLQLLQASGNGRTNKMLVKRFLGGGTDLYVQRPEEMSEEGIYFIATQKNNVVMAANGRCEIDGAAVVTDLLESPVFMEHFPLIRKHLALVSSTPIRNMATVAGNFVNASPIGDLTIFFLALDAQLTLSNGESKRVLPLRSFYKGYKKLDKGPDEFVEKINFGLPAKEDLFNFEKVSKRTHLDIASINTAVFLKMNAGVIESAGIAAGGVGPVPAWLSAGSAFLGGKKITADVIHQLISIIQEEIQPISDARGTEAYKRFLLAQLIKAHFITLFPALPVQPLLQAV